MLEKFRALKKFSLFPFFCGLIAVAIGVIGQSLFSINRNIFALILYIIAISILIIGFSNQKAPDVLLSEFNPGNRTKWALFGYICCGSAIVFSVLAFFLFSKDIPEIIPWDLHLTSMFLLILGVYGLDGFRKTNQQRTSAMDKGWTKQEIGYLLVIFSAGIFMRLYRFNQLPFGTWYDEAVFGLEAEKILTQPGYLPIFVQTMPAHFTYLIALAFKLMGSSTLSIRAVSVAFGLGTIPAAYLAGRELFSSRKIGLVLAFFLAVSRWDVNFSRIGLQGVSLPFFELLSVGLILRGLRKQTLLDYTLAGISTGLSLSFYFPARLFPAVIVIFFIVLWFFKHDLIKSSWRGLVFFGLSLWISSIPVSQMAVFQPDEFWGRIQEASIFNGKTPQQDWAAVVQTTEDHILMFNYKGDRNGRHNLSGEPMLDIISGCLLVLGIALCFKRIRQPGSLLLLLWFFMMLTPGIFSLDFESPQSLRAIGSLPAAYMLAMVPIQAVWQAEESSINQKFHLLLGFLLVVFLGCVGLINYHIYFDLQSVSFDSWNAFSTPDTITAGIMNDFGNQVDYYVSIYYFDTPTVQFLAPGIKNYNKLQTSEGIPLGLDGKKGAVLILDADRVQAYLEAEKDFPKATFKEYKAPDGKTVIYEVYLKPEDILAAQGVTASYYADADWSEKPALIRKENQISGDWGKNDPLPVPFGVEWAGILYVPNYGNYHLVMQSPNPVELNLDGVKVDLQGSGEQSGDVLLAKGTHNFKLRTKSQDGHYELDWQTSNQKMVAIPPADFMSAPVTNNGLLGRFYANDSWMGNPAIARIDPWIHFYFQEIPLPRPYTVEWYGNIQIPKDGHYHFGLESIDESMLYIDEKLIINDQTLNQYQDGEVDLKAGSHSLRLRYVDRTGSTHINLYWKPPDGDQETIPASVLFPPQGNKDLLKPIEGLDNAQKSQNQNQPKEVTPTVLVNTPQLPVDQSKIVVMDVNPLWQTGTCGSGSDQLQDPHGIVLDSMGNVWIADTGNHRVVELDSHGKWINSFGQMGDGDNQFHGPYDLVVEPNGNLVVLDSENVNPLKRFSANGNFISTFGNSLGVYNPRGLGIDKLGNLFLADTGNGRLLEISSTGLLLNQWKISEQLGSSPQPVGITIGADGIIYFTDAVGGFLMEMPNNGNALSWQAVSPFDTMDGAYLRINSKNMVFISDPEKKRIVIYKADGQPSGQINLVAGEKDILNKPTGIALTADGLLLVADKELCQVIAIELPVDLVK